MYIKHTSLNSLWPLIVPRRVAFSRGMLTTRAAGIVPQTRHDMNQISINAALSTSLVTQRSCTGQSYDPALNLPRWSCARGGV